MLIKIWLVMLIKWRRPMTTVRCDAMPGRRFGLLADTYDDAVDWPVALTRILAAMGAIDGIIHCGDLCSAQALETLSAVAPVWAVRSPADTLASPPALVDGPRVLQAGRVRIGVVSSLS